MQDKNPAGFSPGQAGFPPVFLIGMMGSGKTYWAQRIAKDLGIDWIDLDAAIEKETQLTVREIFETEGEAFFRDQENQVLEKVAGNRNIVIATGGGTPCFHRNIDRMNARGITIWIDERIPVLLKRLKPEKDHRPLIRDLSDDQLQDFLSRKLEGRLHFYSQAKYHLQGEDISLMHFHQIIRSYA
jgi:shikimate kinase